MNIVVTGDKGFIGKHLTPELTDPIGFDIKDGFDVTRDKLPKADVYIHLAAEPSVHGSFEHPDSFFETNVSGTVKVLEACRRHKAKLIFASSSQADADAKNPYALHKYICELLIKQYGRLYEVDYSILRLYNVFGEGEHGVVGAFQKALADGVALPVCGGEQRRDFVHVDAVVRELKAAIREWSGCRFIGSGKSTSIQEIADLISDNQVHLPRFSHEPLDIVSPQSVPTLTVQEYLS